MNASSLREDGCAFSRGDGFWTQTSDESKTGFFQKLTERKSQRENWYKISPYIAEFCCAISNVGFLYVGAKHQCPELVFAGLASVFQSNGYWVLIS